MELDKEVTACLTGHRPKGLPWGYNEESELCLSFKKDLKEIFKKLVQKGIKNFLVGMALGFDMIGAEVLQEMRDKDAFLIRVIAVIPCLTQSDSWGEKYKAKYNSLVTNCDDKVVLSSEYYDGCMLDRNRFMVDSSSVVVACYRGGGGGTKNTINYAYKKNAKVIIISPEANNFLNQIE